MSVRRPDSMNAQPVFLALEGQELKSMQNRFERINFKKSDDPMNRMQQQTFENAFLAEYSPMPFHKLKYMKYIIPDNDISVNFKAYLVDLKNRYPIATEADFATLFTTGKRPRDGWNGYAEREASKRITPPAESSEIIKFKEQIKFWHTSLANLENKLVEIQSMLENGIGDRSANLEKKQYFVERKSNAQLQIDELQKQIARLRGNTHTTQQFLASNGYRNFI